MSFSWHAAPYFAAAIVIATTGVLVYSWERGGRASRYFLGFSALFTVWTLLRGGLHLMPDATLAGVIAQYLYCAVALGLPPLFQFIFMVLHTKRERRALIRANWVLGTFLAVLAVGTPWVVSGVQPVPWGVEPRQGPLGALIMAWIAALMSVVTFDAVRAWRRSVAGTLERRRLQLFCASLPILFAATADLLVGIGLPIYPLGFTGVLVFTLMAGYMTWRHGLAEVSARFAAHEIAEIVRGALLVLDADGTVRFMNEQTAQMLGVRPDRAAGVALRSILGDVARPANLAALAQSPPGGETEIVHLRPGSDEARDLALSVSVLRDRRGRTMAFVCLVRDVTEQRQRRLQALATREIDPLTGLPTRGFLVTLLDGAVRHAATAGQRTFTAFVVGIDRLRVINEDLGYGVGDEVLAETARRLTRFVREVGGAPQDTVARIGGDEFGLLLHGDRDAGDVERLMTRLAEVLRPPLRQPDHDLHVAASIGVVTCEADCTGGDDALRKAGIAMHRVKDRGGGGIHVFAPQQLHLQRTRLESELRRALQQQELTVHYQPIVRLPSGRVEGFEALVRWQHPRRGLVSPGDFLPLAEKAGLIAELDRFVLDEACAGLARMRASHPGLPLFVSINQARDALGDARIVDDVGAALQRHGLPAGAVSIEVLETTVLADAARDNLQRLRHLGIGVCIDDFGTGYSSLHRLHDVPVTALKIDRSFVRAMVAGENGRKVIGSIVALANSLQLAVVAEGVTAPAQAGMLLDIGCERAQGYLFSPAVALDAALALLRQDRASGSTQAEPCPA